MGFFDLFKTKKEKYFDNEIISQNELNGWILKEKEEISKKDDELYNDISEVISNFNHDAEIGIANLEAINFEQRNVEVYISNIIKENMKNYISYLRNFISDLKKIKKESDIEEEINILLSDFEKKSSLNYRKMNSLESKESLGIKNIITKFLKNVQRTTRIYEKSISKSRIVKFIESKINEINEINEIKKNVLKDLESSNDKINSLKKEIQQKEKEIEKIKNSDKFIKMEKDKRELDIEKQELIKDIEKLGISIDFKFLTKFYHGIEKKMTKIKKYKDNFKDAFSQNETKELLHLTKEANIPNFEDIHKQVEKINKKQKKINEMLIEKIDFKDTKNEINSIKYKIDEHFVNNKAKERKHKNAEKDLEKINNLLKDKMKELHIKLE